MKTTKYGICPICGSACGLVVEIEDGRITKVTGDREDPHSRGFVCPKGRSLKHQHTDPDRVVEPIRRDGDSWSPVGWDEAIGDIADRIVKVQKKYGRDSLAMYVGDGATHSYKALMATAAFVGATGTKNLYTANSMDTLPRMLASKLFYGNSGVLPIPDVERTGYLLVIGSNPVVSNGSVMTAPGFARYIRDIQKRGGKVVVVDPRRNETAEKSGEHYFIRPETDVFFLLALMNVIFEEKLDRPGALKSRIRGYAALKRRARDFTPERASRLTGIPAGNIRRIAREFSGADTAVCYGRMGTCAQVFGTTASMLVDVLNVITGNFDRPGGAMFTTPAIDMSSVMKAIGMTGAHGKNHTRVSGLPDFNGEMPCAALAEEIEASNGIRALVVVGGNPAVSIPNTARLVSAFGKLEIMVSLDPHVNATSCHADYILAPAIGLEHEIYPVMAYATAVHNVAKWAPRVIDPPPGVKYDSEILGELICRVAGGHTPFPRIVSGGLSSIGSAIEGRELLKLLIALGPHGRLSRIARREGEALTLEDLEKKPHGIWLGQLEPGIDRQLGRRGKINLMPKVLRGEFDRINEFGETIERQGDAAGEDTMILISRRQLRFFNTSLHNINNLATGPEQCVIEINPADAKGRKIKTGDTVKVETDNGTAEIEAEVSDRVMPGVVSIPFGWNGPQPAAQQEVLNRHPGTNVNTITDQSRIDPVSAMTAFNGTRVRVMKRQSGRNS